jgi:hypothetical protein
MPQLSPEREDDLEAFLDDQLADLDLTPAEEARLRNRIRQFALADLQGAALPVPPRMPEPSAPAFAAA